MHENRPIRDFCLYKSSPLWLTKCTYSFQQKLKAVSFEGAKTLKMSCQSRKVQRVWSRPEWSRWRRAELSRQRGAWSQDTPLPCCFITELWYYWASCSTACAVSQVSHFHGIKFSLLPHPWEFLLVFNWCQQPDWHLSQTFIYYIWMTLKYTNIPNLPTHNSHSIHTSHLQEKLNIITIH